MKRIHVPVLALVVSVAAIVAFSCFSGLEPAKSDQGATTLSISFAALESSVESTEIGVRAIAQGPAKLYVQTGFESGTAFLYGPYDAVAGTVTVVQDIPPGIYPWFALIYSTDSLPLTGPVILPAGTDPRGAFQLEIAKRASVTVSVALLPDIAIAEGKTTLVTATLVPVTASSVNAAVGAETPFSRATTAGVLSRDFIAIGGVGTGVPSGNALASSLLTLVNEGAVSASFSNAALYDSAGALIGALSPSSGTVSPGAEAVLVPLSSSLPAAFFLYLEYDGAGYSLVVRNRLATRLLAATSTGNAYWSEDGTTWKGPFATGLTVGAQAATAGTGVFAVTGTPGIASSPDGETWTLHSMPNLVTSVPSVGSNPSGQLVAIGYYGASQSSYPSSDGNAWTAYGTVSYPATNAAWLDGKWYVTTSNGSGWKSSTDGIAWSLVTGSGSGMYQMNRVIGLNGKLISGGGQPANAGMQIQVSSDYGATFAAAKTIPGTAGYVNSFATVGVGRLVVGGSGSGSLVAVTDDYGTTWVAPSYPGTATVNALRPTPLGLFAGDASGKIYRSTDDGSSFALAATLPSAITGIATRTVY